MTMFAKVKEHPDLVRDMNSKAVLNVDNKSLEAYKKSRDMRSKQQQRYEGLKEEIDNIKDDINEIKSLLINMAKG